MPSNQTSAGSSPISCKYLTGYNLIPSGKAMGNHLCGKFPHNNYNREDILHSNRRRSESSMALEEEEAGQVRVGQYTEDSLLYNFQNIRDVKFLLI